MSHSSFSNRVRNRVSGLVVDDEQLLLVKLDIPTRNKPVWMPPGGAIRFGEKAETALEREMYEETGLSIETGELRYIYQYIEKPYHAIELYFDCIWESGTAKRGKDPELGDQKQMILDLDWVHVSELVEYRVEPEFLAERFPEEWRNEIKGPFFVKET